MTLSQRIIFIFIQDLGGMATKKLIVSEFDGYYHANASKHIGSILARMVNNGTLERVKRGLYMINKQNPTVHSKIHPEDPNQLLLFELPETSQVIGSPLPVEDTIEMHDQVI